MLCELPRECGTSPEAKETGWRKRDSQRDMSKLTLKSGGKGRDLEPGIWGVIWGIIEDGGEGRPEVVEPPVRGWEEKATCCQKKPPGKQVLQPFSGDKLNQNGSRLFGCPGTWLTEAKASLFQRKIFSVQTLRDVHRPSSPKDESSITMRMSQNTPRSAGLCAGETKKPMG